MNYLGLEQNAIASTAKELNYLLANYHLYYQNLRNFHWNIQGENFFELHAQFESLYNDALQKIDAIAERILTLRHRPLSCFSDYISQSEIDESHQVDSDEAMIKIILENHRILIINMRRIMALAADCSDEGTIDMIGGFLENLEKKSWMLDAWSVRKLQTAPVL